MKTLTEKFVTIAEQEEKLTTINEDQNYDDYDDLATTLEVW